MDDIYKNIEEYYPNKKRKILMVFDDMIADELSCKKPNPIVNKLFIRVRKLLFCCAKKTKLYALCIMKIWNKRKLQQIAFSYLSYIQFKDLMIL